MTDHTGRSVTRRSGILSLGRSLVVRFTAGSLLILLVVLGIIFVYYPLQQARATRAEVEGRGSALARTVALGVAIGLESGDLSVITETFESAKRDPDLVYMQAVDDGDEPFATYNPSEIGVDNRGLLVVGESPEPMEILHLSAPLSYQNVGFGTLFLGISLEAMSNQIAADRANAAAFGLVMLLVGGVLSVIMVRRVTGPLAELTQAAIQVGAGRLDVSVDVRSQDEVGDLARVFGMMVKKVRTSIENLAASREQLREQADQLLRQTTALNAVLDGSQAAYWDWDIRTGRTHFNARFADMVALREEPELLITSWLTRVHPDDRARVDQELDRHLSGDASFFSKRPSSTDESWLVCLGLGSWASGRA